jgi:hypothetical protein
LERLRRQHKIAGSLPSRRSQPRRLSVLEPGRRRAARRMLTPATVVALFLVVAVVAVAVYLAFG